MLSRADGNGYVTTKLKTFIFPRWCNFYDHVYYEESKY